MAMHRDALDEQVVKDTLGVLLKYQDDVAKVASGQWTVDGEQ